MTAFKLLQWNLRGAKGNTPLSVQQSRLQVLDDLLQLHTPSLVLVQEALQRVDKILQVRGYSIQHSHTANLITAFRTDLWVASVPLPVLDHKHFMLTLLDSALNSIKLAIWNVHLVSRYRKQDKSIANMLYEQLYLQNVRLWRERPQYAGRLEILSGDFNLSPYVEEFWRIRANRSLHWLRLRRRSATLEPELYNTSWPLLTGTRGPAGTYYFDDEHDKPWYVYDQTLVSPELASNAEAEVVLEVRGRRLYRGKYFKLAEDVGSDHYPVIVPLSLTL